MAANFDRVAPVYSILEHVAFADAMQRRRTAFLAELSACRRAIIAGEGTGSFLRAFRSVNPSADVHVIDSSSRMLQRAATRDPARGGGANASRNTRFHHADILNWTQPDADGFDLIVTHFFLDCFTPGDLETVVSTLSGMAVADSRWLVSDFQQPAAGWKAWRAALWIRGLYLFFRWTARLPARRLTDPAPPLKRNGFELARRETACGELLFSELWIRSRSFIRFGH